MKLVSLGWSWKTEEGTVNLSKEFKTADSILQIDALDDWIAELTELREVLLENEHPSVRAVLWGK